MFMNKLVIIVLFCITYKYNYIKGQELNSSVILMDISRAFLEVTNRTRVVNKLLPKMYYLNKTNLEFVFKLPQRNEALIIIKTRNDFLDPQFPEVAMDYKDKKDYKLNSLLSFVEQKNLSNKQTLINMRLNEHDENYAWNMMGLSGWSGIISEPLEIVSKANEMNESPNTDMIFDNGETVEDYNTEEGFSNRRKGLNSTRFRYFKSREKGKIQREDVKIFENDNIYLSRANNPFGYSTNWELRLPLEPSSNYSDIRPDNRTKRDVLRLYSMIKCSTGCEPLMYKRYGCYCGFLGAGAPMDSIDICCKLHDKCYEYSNCISYLEYFVPYIWKCYRGKPFCAVDHGEWGGPRSCAARLCKCDMRLSRCLKKFVCPQKRLLCKTLRVGPF